MTPAPEDEPENAAAEMAEVTGRLRHEARILGSMSSARSPARSPARSTARLGATDVDPDVGATFSTTSHNSMAVLAVAGQVDVRSAASMRRHLLELVDAGEVNIVVDMTGVDFMDSSGLNVLVGAVRAVRPADGSIRVVATSRHLRQLFDVTGVHKILELHETVASAAQ